LSEQQKSNARESDRIRKENIRAKSKNNVCKFKALVKNGPVFVCVACNRTLYRQSVFIFDNNKYQVDHKIFDSRLSSFDGLEYICKTCHQKLLKKKVPCQAVFNDLKLFDFPVEFQNIRKLEKILISKRILFKKVTIMPKGQSPKMKGAICNVPIKADSICNVLPRGMDNNGVVQVALKKKMAFKSNVLLESVRPTIVENILIFLKQNNPLYSDIEINIENLPRQWINTIDNSRDESEIDFVNESEILNVTNDESLTEEDPNPLDLFRLSASETAYVPEVSYEVHNDGNISIAPGENKQPLPVIFRICSLLENLDTTTKGKLA